MNFKKFLQATLHSPEAKKKAAASRKAWRDGMTDQEREAYIESMRVHGRKGSAKRWPKLDKKD